MFKSKVYRLFCFLFSFSLVFALFGVEASAASDNLISSDLTTWQDVSNLQENSFPVNVTTADNIYRVTLTDQDYSVYFGSIIDHTSLIAGHSYSLSFKMPSRTAINSAFNKDYSASVFENHFINSELFIGVAFISPSGVLNMPDDTILFHINKDNYTSYFGKTLNASFIASSFTGTPVVIILINSLDGADHSFYFSNFKLVDNDDNSAELTGIKGFLHSIRWDLVGGHCSEEDCPSYIDGTGHKSLTERLTGGFASMFQSVNDNFTKDNSKLKSWFTSLGESITAFFEDSEGKTFTDWFNDLGGNIKDRFSDMGDDLKDWFEDVGDSFTTLGTTITGKLEDVGKKFTDFFDKFKPRVYVNLVWHTGYTINSDGTLLDTPGRYTNASVVTDFFYASEGIKYVVDFDASLIGADYCFIAKYDSNGNFIERVNKKYFVEYALESGYNYRFQIGNYDFDFTTLPDLSEFCNTYFLLYAEEGWVNALLYNMKMGIKGLFVPDEAFIATWKEEMDTELEAHLGFLYQIPDFTISYMQVIRNTLKDNDTIEFTFPKIEFEFNGEKIHLWDAIQVDFSFLEKEPFSTIYSIYKVGIIIIFGAALFMYGKHVWKKVMAN